MPSKKPRAPRKRSATQATAADRDYYFAENCKYIFNLRQHMPAELRDIVNNWLTQMANYANKNQAPPPLMGCAVSTLMAVIIQTHIDCASQDGVPHDTAMQQMLDYFDLAARVELGIISFKHTQEPRH